MELNHSNGEKTKTELKVVKQSKEKFFVKFPSLETPVEMTKRYFQLLIATGAYTIIFEI